MSEAHRWWGGRGQELWPGLYDFEDGFSYT